MSSEDFSADFMRIDKGAPLLCGRPDCSTKFFPPDAKFEYLHSNDSSQPGRAVCGSCYNYYRQKQTTRRQAESSEYPIAVLITLSHLRYISQSSNIANKREFQTATSRR